MVTNIKPAIHKEFKVNQNLCKQIISSSAQTPKNVHLENRSLSLAGVRLGSSLGRRLSDLLLLLVLDGRGGLLLLVAVTSLAKLVDTLVVNLVLPALVEPD